MFAASWPKFWGKNINIISHRITATTKTKQFKRVVHESIKVLRKCWKHLQNISCHATIKDAKHNTMSKRRSVDMTASFTEKTSCFFSCYTLTSQSLGLPKLRDQWRHHGDVETICGLVHQPSIQALRETATDSCPPDLPPDRLPLKGSRMWRSLDMSWGFFFGLWLWYCGFECLRNSLFSS